ncbi:MAG TPA: MATE family efflux transporter [Candidatus Goldiibacteriota bacterium]|nr:MATE family efflux transporter [Candidatus Goldiibacteriota bacterium]
MRELEKGSIFHNLLYLSVPILITNLMQNFFSVFDMFLLGKIGVSAQAAISITGFIFGIFWSMEGGLVTGASAVISRYAGKKDYAGLKKAAVNVIFAGYVMGLLFALVNIIFMDNILVYFGAKGETYTLAKSIYLLSLITLINDSGLFVFFGVLRAAGGIRKHFYLLFISIALNIILEPVFIYGWLGFPRIGIMGVPLARLASYFITTFIMIYILTCREGILRIQLKDVKLDRGFLANYVGISIPAMLQGVASNIAALTMLKIAAPHGDALLATMGIGSRIDVFVMMLGWAIGSSVSVMVGHNMGAGQIKRAEGSVTTGLKMYSLFTFMCWLIAYNFAPMIIKFFNPDYMVIQYGVQYLRIVSPFYLLMGVGLLAGAAFNGAGSTKTPMAINIAAFFALQIPMAFFLSKNPAIGHRAIFISIAAVFVFQGVVGWILYKKGHWKSKEM